MEESNLNFFLKILLRIFLNIIKRGAFGLLFVFYFLLFNSKNLRAQEIDKVALNQKWLKLLYYDKSFFNYKSKIKNKEYFIGNDFDRSIIDPKYELEETIKLINERSKVLCKFPARVKFIENTLNLSPFDFSICDDYQNFLKRVNLESVSIVFSSYYVSAPASAFGHTLLKLNQKSSNAQKKSDLLDYGLNFAANVDVDNAIVYAVKGLTGLFNGSYTLIPYYYKIREYNDFESRDLWEYELSMSEKEKELFIDHVWELGNAQFKYYYIDENCSYQLIRLLDVVYDSKDLLNQLSSAVIPIDTIKILEKNNLIKNSQVRLSQRERAKLYTDKLTSNLQQILVKITEDPSEFNKVKDQLNENEKVLLLDAAIELIDYLKPQNLVAKDNTISKEKQALLNYRSEIAIISKELEIHKNQNDDPRFSHQSRRAGFFYSNTNRQSSINFEYRLNLHDLLDPNIGTPTGSQIEFFNFNLNYHLKNKTTRLSNLTLFKVTNLVQLNPYKNSLSWYGELLKSPIYSKYFSENFYGFKTAGGITYKNISLLGKTEIGLVKEKPLINFGPEIFYLKNFDQFSFMFKFDYLYFAKSFYENQFTHFGQTYEARYHLDLQKSIKLKFENHALNNTFSVGYYQFF